MAKWWERDINFVGGLGDFKINPKDVAQQLAGTLPSGGAALGLIGNEQVKDLGQQAGLNDVPFVGGLFGESSEEQAAQDLNQGFERARGDVSRLYGQAGKYYEPYMGLAGAFPQMQQDVNAGMYSQPQYQMGQFNQGQYQDNPYQMGQFDQGQFQDQPHQMGQFNQGPYQDQNFQLGKFNFEQDPGYQFAKEQGLAGVRQAMGAQGLSESGAEMKELARFSEGLASQRYGDAFNRYAQGQGLGMQANQLNQAGLQNRFGRFAQGQNLGLAGARFNQDALQNRFGRFAQGQQLGMQGNQLNQAGLQNRFNRFNQGQQLGMQGTQLNQDLLNTLYNQKMGLANTGMNAINQRAGMDMGLAELLGQMQIGQAQGTAAAKMAQAAGRRAFLGDAMGMAGSAIAGG